MVLEVENDDIIAKPMNALYYEESEGYPAGYVIRKLPERVHDTWRPLIERLAADPFSVVVKTDAVIASLVDPNLRVLKRKQASLTLIDCLT